MSIGVGNGRAAIYAERSNWGGEVELLIVDNMGSVARVEYVPHEEFIDPQPSLKVKVDVAQGLMDELWRCGLRPSEGSGSAGALRAVESHRDDLKKIAFHALKIKQQ
jgi:hypothetical protein